MLINVWTSEQKCISYHCYSICYTSPHLLRTLSVKQPWQPFQICHLYFKNGGFLLPLFSSMFCSVSVFWRGQNCRTISAESWLLCSHPKWQWWMNSRERRCTVRAAKPTFADVGTDDRAQIMDALSAELALAVSGLPWGTGHKKRWSETVKNFLLNAK